MPNGRASPRNCRSPASTAIRRNFSTNELNAPVDIDALVAAAVTDAQKVELYTASRLTIEPKTRAERGYLDLLAGRLKLPDSLIDHIEATVANVKTNTPA